MASVISPYQVFTYPAGPAHRFDTRSWAGPSSQASLPPRTEQRFDVLQGSRLGPAGRSPWPARGVQDRRLGSPVGSAEMHERLPTPQGSAVSARCLVDKRGGWRWRQPYAGHGGRAVRVVRHRSDSGRVSTRFIPGGEEINQTVRNYI